MHNNKILLAEARAISAALLVARLGGIAFDRAGDTAADLGPLPTSLYSSAAQLMIVPTVEQTVTDIAAASLAMQVARADALLVRPRGDSERFSLTIHAGLYRPDEAVWHVGQRLYLAESGSAYLIPSGRSPAEHHACFALTSAGLRAKRRVPWSSDTDCEVGLARADALIAAALEGR